MMAEFKIECAYCVPTNTLCHFESGADQDEKEFRAAWKATTTTGVEGGPASCIGCPSCGSYYQIADDGVDLDSGGTVVRNNISAPKISSLNIVLGAREGGNALFVTGVALDIGTLVVKFAGQVCPIVDTITPTSARVVVPTATYELNVDEQAHLLTATLQSGTLSVDENVTTPAGSTGVIRRIDGSTYWVVFSTLVELPPDMIGVNMTGGTDGGFATIDAISFPVFEVGENVSGTTSAAQGTVSVVNPLTVESPTQGFAPQELVLGNTSNALVRLATSPAYSGLVDVSVENEYGQRLVGGDLPDAYTYA